MKLLSREMPIRKDSGEGEMMFTMHLNWQSKFRRPNYYYGNEGHPSGLEVSSADSLIEMIFFMVCLNSKRLESARNSDKLRKFSSDFKLTKASCDRQLA